MTRHETFPLAVPAEDFRPVTHRRAPDGRTAPTKPAI